MKTKITDENTNSLKDNEIFVFGSNLAGVHDAGAAKLAKEKFKAENGIGEGLTGQCYALPTKNENIKTLPISEIHKSIEVLLTVIKDNQDKFFIVTAVGCGLAGYKASEIAPMFEPFVHLENVSLPKSFVDVIFPPTIMGYKVTDENMKCIGTQYTMNKKHSVKGDIIICENGIHFCKKLEDCFNYYNFSPYNRVFEVCGSGNYDFKDDKIATRTIEFTKELNWFEVLEKVNKGVGNSGMGNSGDRNSGYRNSGDYNSGYDNSGDYNSGYFNSGDRNSGYFNNDTPTVRMFGKDTGFSYTQIDIPYINLSVTQWVSERDMTDEEKKSNHRFYVTKGYLKTYSYKEAWAIAWKELNKTTKNKFLTLPNFDAEIFEDITGIKL